MKTNEKIRQLRELNEFSQEDMSEKFEMSPSGYAKIERGETRLTLEHLKQFSEIFNVDINNLVNSESNFTYQVNANNTNSHNDHTSAEIEKLQLTLAHKNEIIARLKEQIGDLRALNEALKK